MSGIFVGPTVPPQSGAGEPGQCPKPVATSEAVAGMAHATARTYTASLDRPTVDAPRAPARLLPSTDSGEDTAWTTSRTCWSPCGRMWSPS